MGRCGSLLASRRAWASSQEPRVFRQGKKVGASPFVGSRAGCKWRRSVQGRWSRETGARRACSKHTYLARAELRSRRQSVQSEAFPLYLGWHLRSPHHRVWYVWKAFFKRKAIVFLEFTYLYTVIIICRNCSTYTAMIFFLSFFFKRTSPELRHVNWDLSRNLDAVLHVFGP